MIRYIFVIGVVLGLIMAPRIALAHAVVIACLPRIGSNVAQAPTELICQFNEPLNPERISITVTDPQGNRVDRDDTQFYEGDPQTIVVSLDTERMGRGVYNVAWQVTDTLDAGTTTGTLQFGLNEIVPPTPTAVIPGVPMTPTPVETSGGASELISRFLIALGVVALGAVGILFWRMRKDGGERES